METTISDSTALRMRSSLQRSGQGSSGQGTGEKTELGFLDTLLNLQVRPIEVRPEEEPVADQMAPWDQPLVPEAEPSSNAQNRTEEPQVEEEAEEAKTADCLLAICPPPTTSVLVETAAESTSEQVVTVSNETGVASDTTTPVVAQVETIEAQPIVDQPVETGAAEPDIAAVGPSRPDPSTKKQTVNQAANPANATANVPRAGRRSGAEERATKPVSAKSEVVGTSERRLHQSAKAQSAAKEQVSATSAEIEQPQVMGQPDEPVALSQSEKPNTNDQREKWFQSKDEHHRQSNIDPAQGNDQNKDDLVNDAAVATANQSPADALTGTLDANALVADQAAPPVDVSHEMLAAAAAASQAATQSTVSAVENASSQSVSSNAGRSTASAAVSSTATTRFTGSSTSTDASATRTDGKRSTDKANNEAESPSLTQQERVRLVQRVARSFSRLGPDVGQVTLKLHPPQLGVLNVSIRMDGNTLTAKMQTESSAARDAILDNLPQLKERLNEQGIEIEKFQVDVGANSEMSGGNSQMNGSSGESSSSNARSDAASSVDYRRLSRAVQPPIPAVASAASNWLDAAATLDRSLDIRA